MVSVLEKKRITYNDYVMIADDKRYEVFHGELRMVPAPSMDHQGISRDLGVLIWKFAKEKKLGTVFFAPVDVIFDDDEVYQPDIVFIKGERRNIIKKNAIHGVPDMVVEIISPSSTFYDTVEKKEVYRKYGVQEYWVVFPGEKGIEVLALEKQGYQEFSKARKRGVVKSKVLEELAIDLKEVFD